MGNDDGQPKRTVYGIPGPTSGMPAQRTPQPPPRQVVGTPQPGGQVVVPQSTRVGTGPVVAQRPMQTAPGSADGTHALPQQQTRDPQPPMDVAIAGIGLEAGTNIDKYELIRELGRGGMGIVFAARDMKLGRRVAIKFLLNATRLVADRFIAEAQATAKFNHENIVTIHEVNDNNPDMPYMVLEFLEGQPMRGLMGSFNAGQMMAPTRVVELVLPIAKALAAAHAQGIVHRDLKPENVFVTSTGQVKVLDFGIAKALGKTPAPTPKGGANRTMYAPQEPLNLTREGAMVGTLPYMSPEQMGIGEVDPRSDIWALGIIIWEMLLGKHPIEPLTTDRLITNAIDDEPMPSLRDVAPHLPEALIALVTGCLRKRQEERIPSAAEIVRRLEDMQPGRVGRQLAEGESPYPGLTAFQENDADRFFGRSRDVTRMVAKVRELPITGIVGPSGVGKSSFIRAGVGPALKASGEHWDVITLRPGRQPLAALASVVQRLTTRTGADAQKQMVEHAQMIYRLRNEPGYVGTLLRNRARATNQQLLLFVDQFEELYTLVPDAEERRVFTAALAGVADDTAAPMRVVVSMRSDFLDRIGEDPRFMEELSRGLVFLQPPDAAGLREALTQPIEMVGYRFETDAMVDDMLAALAGMPGALPLLQFAASKLWDARDRTNRLLTMSSYQAIGGIQGALATHADDVVAQMAHPQQKLTQKIFRRLVTPERTRAIVELADLYQLSNDRNEVARIIDQLVTARLLVVQTRGDAGGGSAEIVHESLIDRWPTMRRWLDEDQEDAAFLAQLAAAAKQWEQKGHASGLLWRGDAMEEARRWYNQRPRELTPRDHAYLQAVFSLARRGKRVRTALLAITFVVLGGGALAASAAALSIRSAKQTAEEKEQEAKKSESAAMKAMADTKTAMDALVKKTEEKEAAQKLADAASAKATEAEKEQAAEAAQHKADNEKSAAQLKVELDAARAAEARAETSANEAKKAKDALAKQNESLKGENERLKSENSKLSHSLK
ncbi:MAG: protein kinase [Kofleriaceae bacterium]